MEVLKATEAKREFGEVLIKAQRAPIGINKNGKPVAVIMSSVEYEELQRLKEYQLRAAIQEGIDDINAGRVMDGKEVLDSLRKLIS